MIDLSQFYPTVIDPTNLVYVTGNQRISGQKDFNVRPTVNGAPVVLYGEYCPEDGGGGGGGGTNIVYTTGDQEVFGVKFFQTATNLAGSPFLSSGEGKFLEKLFTLNLDSNNLEYYTPGYPNSIVFVSIPESNIYSIYLPDTRYAAEGNFIKFIFKETPLNNTQFYDPGNLDIAPSSGLYSEDDTYYAPGLEVNFYSNDPNSNNNYEPFFSKACYPVRNNFISFLFRDGAWIVENEKSLDEIPYHIHSLDDIPGLSGILDRKYIYLEKLYHYTFSDGNILFQAPVERNTYANLTFNTPSTCYVDLPNPTTGDIRDGDRIVLNVQTIIQQPQRLTIRHNPFDGNGNYLPYYDLYNLPIPNVSDALEFWFQSPEWVLKSSPNGNNLGGDLINDRVVYIFGNQEIRGSKNFIATGFYYSGAYYRYDKHSRVVFEDNVFINKINNQTSFGVYNYYNIDNNLPISGQLSNLPLGIRTGNIVNLFFNNTGLNNSLENAITSQPTLMIQYTGNIYNDDIIPIINHKYYKNKALKKINYDIKSLDYKNIVYTTGDQEISGNKTFKADSYIFSGTDVAFVADDYVFSGADVAFVADDYVFSGADVSFVADDYVFSGADVSFTKRPTVNGTGVLLQGETIDVSTSQGIINTTYSELTGLKAVSGLNPGQYYRISDFQLMWWNQSVNDTTVKSGLSPEPLIVLALSGNKISHEAKSELYPQDTIYYDIDATSSNSWGLINNNTAIPNFKGWIYRRIDHKLNIDIPWDWRHITVNCCRPDMSSISLYNAGTPYSVYSVVKDASNKLYYSIQDSNTGNGLDFTDWWLPVSDFTEGDTYFVTEETFGFRAYNKNGAFVNLPADTSTRIQQPTFTSSLVSQGTFQLTSCNNIKIEGGYSNVFLGTYNFSNTIGINFFKNTIGNNFYSNTIGDYSFNNTIGNSFRFNTIRNNFYNNTIRNDFNSNTIGNNFYINTIGNDFYNNTIGNYFDYNTIGNSFRFNTIRNNFYSNTIGNSFRFNTIGNYFEYNTIGNWFYNNTIGNDFYNNTIGNTFRGNTVENTISMGDVTGATHIYNNYNTRIFSNSNNTVRLSYFNSSDQLVVTDPTA